MPILEFFPYLQRKNQESPDFGTGEGNFSCFGIWQVQNMKTNARKLEYLAKPEVAVQIVKIDEGIPALTDIQLEKQMTLIQLMHLKKPRLYLKEI